MAYCTKADIINLELPAERLQQLTGDADPNTVNDDVINAAIEAADSEIDAYLQGRYAVPLSVVPASVKRASACIAVYLMFRRLRRKDEAVWDSYIKALAWLADVRDAKLSLAGASDGCSAVGTTDGVTQEFTRTKKDSNGNIIGGTGSMEVW